MTLRVALIDDHVLFRQGLRALLAAQRDIDVVAEASTAEAAYSVIAAARPDVVVLDVTLPDASGIVATREIRRRQLCENVLILTMHEAGDYVSRAFSSGANGYALKHQPAEQVIEAIRSVGQSRRYLAPGIPATRITTPPRGRVASSEPQAVLEDLSPREREIFELLVRNLSNRDIAERLRISVKTVETHHASINRKLAVHSTAELVRLAALCGLLHE